MPVVKGDKVFKAMQKLYAKKAPDTRIPPFVIFTAQQEVGFVRNMLKVGINEVVHKPA